MFDDTIVIKYDNACSTYIKQSFKVSDITLNVIIDVFYFILYVDLFFEVIYIDI